MGLPDRSRRRHGRGRARLALVGRPRDRLRVKFGPDAAERWSEEAYADPVRYLSHRAELVRSLGPPLQPGDTVLDLACGDAGLAEFLLPHGLDYVGVDVSPAMVESAAKRVGARAERGDVDTFAPREPVAATTLFRALYYPGDREAFFRRVAGFTEKKLVFDLNPRQYPLVQIRGELARAGWTRLETRPFFVPQTVALPAPLQSLLLAAESTRGISDLLLRFRFTYVCAAFRSSER
jgi:Methyltransferase domain